jgi:hypothetical protein
MSEEIVPYREAAPRRVQYACLCCLSLGVHAGGCERCQVPRLFLGDAEVVRQVREQVGLRRQQLRLRGGYLSLAATVLIFAVGVGLTSVLSGGFRFAGVLMLLLWPPISLAAGVALRRFSVGERELRALEGLLDEHAARALPPRE